MKAVILAGGLGTRLKPFTRAIPKPLLPVGEKAVMEIQIELLRKYGFTDIFVATNYKSNYIENFFKDGSRYGVNLYISKERKRLGTAGPLKLIEKELTEPFIVMNGDILTSANLKKMYKFAVNTDTLLTIAIKKEITPFAFGNITFKGDYVMNIEEKPDLTFFILAGIYVMKPEILRLIPSNKYYGMDQLIQYLLKKKISITKYEIKEYWLDIGRLSDYEKAQGVYKKHFKDKK